LEELVSNGHITAKAKWWKGVGACESRTWICRWKILYGN